MPDWLIIAVIRWPKEALPHDSFVADGMLIVSLLSASLQRLQRDPLFVFIWLRLRSRKRADRNNQPPAVAGFEKELLKQPIKNPYGRLHIRPPSTSLNLSQKRNYDVRGARWC